MYEETSLESFTTPIDEDGSVDEYEVFKTVFETIQTNSPGKQFVWCRLYIQIYYNLLIKKQLKNMFVDDDFMFEIAIMSQAVLLGFKISKNTYFFFSIISFNVKNSFLILKYFIFLLNSDIFETIRPVIKIITMPSE
jgi:hypothetical protein